jgi:hypothetical protein
MGLMLATSNISSSLQSCVAKCQDYLDVYRCPWRSSAHNEATYLENTMEALQKETQPQSTFGAACVHPLEGWMEVASFVLYFHFDID